MVAKDIILSIEPVPFLKTKIRPFDINADFVTVGCFKYVEVTKRIVKAKKVYDEAITDRFPLMLLWDGKEMKWCIGEDGSEIIHNDKTFILDRSVGDGVPLPSEGLIGELMDKKKLAQTMKSFEAKDLFKEIHDYFERYFYLEKDYLYSLVTLYVANMWVFDAHDSTPYMFIRSPMRGCGKTLMGTSIASMSNGEMIATPNAVHIFRMSHDTKTPMVLDEIKKLTSDADKLTQDDKDVLSLINTGFQKYGCKVPRAAETTIGGRKAYKIEMYESYTPKVLITTDGVLPHDTLSRCIDLRMQMASPAGINYDERWNEPERLERIKKIKDLGILFRLKYGSEIYKISKDINHRTEMDTEGLFASLHGRSLEIFRPLIILALKYMPEWKTGLSKYVEKYLQMKEDTEPSIAHLVLMALKKIHVDVSKTNFKNSTTEYGEVAITSDEVFGEVIKIPIKHITNTISDMTSLNPLGQKPDDAVIRKLDELGFVSGSKLGGKKTGNIRTIKIKQLDDMVERYGIKLPDEEPATQQERYKQIREALSTDQLTMTELKIRLEGKQTMAQIEGAVTKFVTDGKIMKTGNMYEWIGA